MFSKNSATPKLVKIIPIGKLSPLQEDSNALLRDSGNGENRRPCKARYSHMVKGVPRTWLARAENQMPSAMATPTLLTFSRRYPIKRMDVMIPGRLSLPKGQCQTPAHSSLDWK